MIAPSSSAPESTLSPAKPRVSIFLATGCGLGYLPKAPGTWGSLGGLALAIITFLCSIQLSVSPDANNLLVVLGPRSSESSSYFFAVAVITVILALVGVWSAGQAARFWGEKDPQRVVIDEVSGQYLTLFLGCVLPIWRQLVPDLGENSIWGVLAHDRALNWKYLAVGLILFRTFDIWKPFPVRQAESLPAGWGIMADDWMAGIYAALGLWLARALGL